MIQLSMFINSKDSNFSHLNIDVIDLNALLVVISVKYAVLSAYFLVKVLLITSDLNFQSVGKNTGSES